jgi:hypothetical protein
MGAAMSCFDSYVYSQELNSYFIAGVTYSVLTWARFAVQDESVASIFLDFFPERTTTSQNFSELCFLTFFFSKAR